MTLRVAVTGVTGFLGGHIAYACSIRPETDVLGLAREARTLRGIEAVAVNLMEARSVQAALAGVDVLVHAAAAASSARALVAGCEAAGVRRIVHVSSVAVFGGAPDGRLHDGLPTRPATAYGRMKLEEETAIRDAAVSAGISLVVLRAPAVYGAHMKGAPLRLSRWVQRGHPLPRAGGCRSLMYAGNLAAAVMAAAVMEEYLADVYVVDDGFAATPLEFGRQIAAALNMKAPWTLPLPAAAIRGFQSVSTRFPEFRIRGMSVSEIARMFDDVVADGSRFAAAARFCPPVAPKEGVRRAAHWLRGGTVMGTVVG